MEIREVAQVVNDLKTLGIITDDEVITTVTKDKLGKCLKILVPESDYDRYFWVQKALLDLRRNEKIIKASDYIKLEEKTDPFDSDY